MLVTLKMPFELVLNYISFLGKYTNLGFETTW